MRMLFSTVLLFLSRMKRDAPESSPCCNDPANRGLIARDSKARRSCARSSRIASFFPPMTGPRYLLGDGAGGGVYHFFRRRVFL